MSLRTRLIIAFLLLSVVPLTAVTMFWYASSVRAFERAAQREASESAVDMGRRMELITADVGRRMDRLFQMQAAGDGEPDAESIRKGVAPLLGDAAALVERVEFRRSGSEPNGVAPVPGVAPAPPVPPAHAAPPVPGAAPPPPPPPEPVIVVDVGKMLDDAQAAAATKVGNQLGALGPMIAREVVREMPEVQASIKAAVDAWADAAGRKADAERLQMQREGRRVAISVKKGGRVVGTANATLNLERTLGTVMTFARREQGEVPFAIDQRGKLYTPDERQRPMLETLGVLDLAQSAADGPPRRSGDWVVVARRDESSGLLFGIARPIGESLREIRRMSLRNLGMGLGVIALACIGIVPISHRMTEHVRSLNAGVRQLASGDFKARVPVQSSDELGALAAAFNRMAADLERHQALVVQQERLRKELELSRLIQTEMLPRARLRLGAAEIKGVSIPAREVGGDFFNYFAMPDGRMALLVGDVSGKGVSAALLMANVQATLRARLPLEDDLATLADQLDREMDVTTPRGVYLTLFLALLDADGRKLRYVNAGHNPQFLIPASGGILPLASTGMPIALYAGQGYTEAQVDMGAGDLLFFYTDGLVETENEKNEMFGADRLQVILAAEHGPGVDGVLERVERTVRSFRGAAEPFDDATMMALRVNA